jgi:hypothetical protein
LGIFLLGQDKFDAALVEFQHARQAGYTGGGEFYARAYDARGQHAEADKVYAASTSGRQGWQDDAAVSTWLDRQQWVPAREAAQAWYDRASANNDVLETLRAQAALASVGIFSGDTGATRGLQSLLAAVDRQSEAVDAIYPPASTELRMYAGLLAAYRDDRAGVDAALRSTDGSVAVREFPTLAQLRQVLLAEQARLSGQPKAAVARLQPLAKQDTALVAVHWALLRAERSAGNAVGMQSQANWLATHRGRVLTEATTTEVLRFFNVAIRE